jgi:membrane protease YdiL (CAAX protease family)
MAWANESNFIMYKLSDLVSILIAALSLRAVFGVMATGYGGDLEFFIKTAGKLTMYMTLGTGCICLFAKNRIPVRHIFGIMPKSADIFYAAILGAGIFAFTLGENAVEVLLTAQYDAEFAYRFWGFHEIRRISAAPFSIDTFVAIIIGCLVAPCLEELYFRGTYLHSANTRQEFRGRAAISTIIFTALHFTGFYYGSVIVFSVVVSLVYRSRGSTILCAITHASYNFLAFVTESHSNFHFVRTRAEIASVTNWAPQLFLLGVSLIIFSTIPAILFRKIK